jgi:hypothetical protein
MSATRTAQCACCGKTFTVPRRPGPAPQYCSHAHRQRAYEARRGGSRAADLAEEVEALRAHVRRLEYDNRRLREELTETGAEMSRLYRDLHPTPPGLAALTGQPQPAAEAPDTPGRKRRRFRGTDT